MRNSRVRTWMLDECELTDHPRGTRRDHTDWRKPRELPNGGIAKINGEAAETFKGKPPKAPKASTVQDET